MTDPRLGLAGTVALIAGTAAALFAVALTAEDRAPVALESTAGSPATDPERLLELSATRTPRVARRVAAIRDLEFRRVPNPELATTDRLRRRAERALAKPRVQRRLAVAEAELRLLGLLDPGQSLTEVATDITALALAYYDPRRDGLFVVGDAVPPGPQLAELILAHELTHALEDQRFGLPTRSGLSDDRALAENALVEGTATALMFEYARRHLDPLALAFEASELQALDSGDLPRFAEAEVSFAYIAGAEFVEALLELGNEWALVDFAFEVRRPRTTEQVLHPGKYLDDERPLPVAPPAAPGRDWRALDSGSLGEFGSREVLRAGEAATRAGAGAEGWGGDRYRLFVRQGTEPGCDDGCRGTHALGLAWRGDDAAETRELAAELRDYVTAGLGGEPAAPNTWRLDGGWAALELRGDRAGLGLAPSARIARRIASAG